jgi:hypothetical protein
MSVDNLETPERGMNLQTRDKGAKKWVASAESELEALRERIAAGLAATPEAPIPECVACYRKGWMAALRALADPKVE